MSVKTCFPSAHPYFCNWLIFTLSTAYLGVLNYVIYVKVVPFELNSMLKIVRRISLIYMLYVYIFSSIFVLLFFEQITFVVIWFYTLPYQYLTLLRSNIIIMHFQALFFFIITSFQMGAGYCQAKANVIRVGARNHEAAKFGSIHV